MKTRTVAVVIAGIVIASVFAYLYDQMYDCLYPPIWMKIPRTNGIDDCLQMYYQGTLPDYTQARENHAKEMAHRNTMIEMFSDVPEVAAFYEKHGNDANVSVRDDHVSYFAGDEESFHPRMNLHYDEKNDLTHMRFYCFDDRGVQYEVSQEDILHYLKNNDCLPENLSSNLEIGTMSDQGCASLFDDSWSAWGAYAKEAQSSGVQWEPPTKQGIISGSEFFAEFRDTDCRYTVNDWAYLTENQSIVWNGIPWPNLKSYPHEHLNAGDVMVLEVFPKSNPLKGNHYVHQIKPGEHPYLWAAIRHGNVILDLDEADQFLKEFADKSSKFEMHMPDGTTQIWRMTYGEKQMQDNRHLVEAIVFASDIPGDAPNMPYVKIPQEIVPIVVPLTEREKQFHYQEVTHDDAIKIYKMLDENGIMFTMNNEKLFLKYLGPLLKSENLDETTATHAEKKWTASQYLNYLPLPNGKFEKNLEKIVLWNMMDELEKYRIGNWRNDPDTGAHTDEGWMNPSKMCSKIFLEDSTELYVSSKFYSEPELNITEIVIDDSKPEDCQKWFWIPNDVSFENGIMVYKYDD
ncbi:hypothetical protein K0U27_10505 [archaeon]|nr:hypothetical protein [archaeon]